MRTVRDDDGNRYLLLKRSAESSEVRNPETGETTYLDNDDIDLVEGESPLETAANAVDAPVRRILTAVPHERALGLLVEIDARGPFSVRHLLDATDLCESDLLGILTEFRAAGLLAETRIAGERGYETTAEAAAGLVVLRGE